MKTKRSVLQLADLILDQPVFFHSATKISFTQVVIPIPWIQQRHGVLPKPTKVVIMLQVKMNMDIAVSIVQDNLPMAQEYHPDL